MILRCQLCGGDLTIDMKAGTATCIYCESVMTLSGIEEFEKIMKRDNLLTRAFQLLEDSKFEQAGSLADEALLIDSQFAKAHVAKLMSQLKCNKETNLQKYPRVLADFAGYKRALECADDDYKSVLVGYNDAIVNRLADEKLFNKITEMLKNTGANGGLGNILGMFAMFKNERPEHRLLKEEIERMMSKEGIMEEAVKQASAEIESADEEMTQEEKLISKIYELNKITEDEAAECFYLYRKKYMWHERKCAALREQKAKLQQVIDDTGRELKACGVFDMKQKKAINDTLKQYKEAKAKLDKELGAKPPVSRDDLHLLKEMFNENCKGSERWNQPIEDYRIEELKNRYDITWQAEDALAAGDYDKVKELLRQECLPSQIHNQKARYQQVLEYIANRNFRAAFAELVYLYRYKNARELFLKCILAPGAFFRFGQYNWRVLDVKENQWLVIMDTLIPDAIMEGDNQPVQTGSWESSYIRKWLNSEFLEMSFNRVERQQIQITNIEDENCGSIEDRIFLLSQEEVDKYFVDDRDRRASYDAASYEGNDWYIRTVPQNSTRFAYVTNAGNIMQGGFAVAGSKPGIRPTMWIEANYN